MQLKDDKSKVHFDIKAVENFLIKENKFITDIFSIVAFPERYDEASDEEDDEDTEESKIPQLANKKSRATCIADLQKRLGDLHSKKKLSYKEKKIRKGLKTKLQKKKNKDKNAQEKMVRAQKIIDKVKDVKKEEDEPTEKKHELPPKPVYNSENKMVFSKIDFTGLGQQKKIHNVKKLKKIKKEKDPKTILEKLEKDKQKLKQLEAEGEVEKVAFIKEKTAWKNALAKAQGEKVKDDPSLLKRTVMRLEQRKRQSAKKWENRVDGVKKAKDEKQKKRTDNLDKRKMEKKKGKMKRAVKRGRIMPGH